MNTPVKIEDAIKTETAVIEVNEEVNESVKVRFSRHGKGLEIDESKNKLFRSLK